MNYLFKAVGCLRARRYWHALATAGVAAGWEHERVLQATGSRTVVDVGANRGQFALAVRQALPRARVFSFEPLPQPARIYERIFRGDPQVTLYPVAVGPRRERAAMHVSGRDDSSSLLPIGKRQTALFPGTREVGIQSVEVGPLDNYLSFDRLSSPAMLKIDVQGYELETLKGCERLLPAFAWAYVECSFIELYEGQAVADDVLAWMHERRMRLGGVYNVANDSNGVAVQADFLFCRVPS